MFSRTLVNRAALATVAVLSMAACSSTPAAQSGAAQSVPEAPAAAAPQSEPQSAAEPAAAAGTLVVYSGRNEKLVGPLLEQFTTDTGIKVDVRYGDTPELAAQLLSEGDATPAQVFLSQDAGALGLVSGKGMFTELPKEVTSKVDAHYTSKDNSWVGLTGRARVIAYDSEKYSAGQVPGDVFELTKPEWKGKVGIAPANASFQSFVTAIRVKDGEAKAEEWLKGMIANEAKIYAKNGEILEAVNTGAVDLGLINHYYWARSEQDPTTLRAQLKFGDKGTTSALVNVTGVGILKGAADKPEARAFVDYLLSDKGQDYFLTKTFEYPLVNGGKTPANVPPLAELGGPDIALADLASLEETVALLTKVGLL